jgi:hypothetical protein
MSAKKIFRAYVTYSFDMFVVADNEDQAEAIAEDNAEEALRACFLEPDVSVREVKPEHCVNEDERPYGDDDDKTVAEYAAEAIEAQREAEERARIEANQLKLPFNGGTPS